MSDIEQGLKEAIAEAQSKEKYGGVVPGNIVRSPQRRYGRDFPDAPVGNGLDRRPPLTAPQIIETIDTLTKSASVLESLAFELSSDLAGHDDSAGQAQGSMPSVEYADMALFDRMGARILELTRIRESIEREVKRSLGAVKP